MKVRQMLIPDFRLVREWFQSHWGFDCYDALPSTGFIAEECGMPIAALFLYQSNNSQIAMVSWLVSNPGSTADGRDDAFESLLKHVEVYAKEAGYKALVGLTGMHAIGKRFENLGYKLGDKFCRQYAKKLGD